MATFSKQFLSASVNGRGIPLGLITGSNPLVTGSILHATPAGTASTDEIFLYAVNNSVSDCILITQFGGNPLTSGDAFFTQIPAQNGRVLITDGRILNNGLIVYGLVSGSSPLGASGVCVDGYANRITN